MTPRRSSFALVRLSFAVCGLAATLSGCAILSKSAPLEPRYFSPETPESTAAAQSPAVAPATANALRLDRVEAGAYLRERIVYRASPQELGVYDELRWTERPEVYLRRALTRALFEQRGLHRVVSGPAPALAVELLAFEELREPRHAARVQVQVSLANDRETLFQQTFAVEQPIAGGADDADRMVTALAAALHEAVERIAERVVAELGAAAAASDPRLAGAASPTAP